MTQSRQMMHPQSHRVTKKRQYISKRKKKRTPTTTTSSSDSSEPSLPDDIIFFHILPKLPVRCLLRFNCVSKLWYTTIHDPNFHASQFSHAKSNPSLVAMLSRRGGFICFLKLKEGAAHHHHPNSNNNDNDNNKWRNVTSTCNYPPFYCPADLTPICISGTLFWMTYRKGRILSFDLHHEKFHLIACPKVPQELILHTLFELEGHLCLVYRYDDDLKDEVQLTLFACKDHQQFRLVHIASSSSGGGARWIRLKCIRPPLKPGIKLIRVAEFAKQIYLHWVTMDGHFTLWDVIRKRWIYNKLLGLSTTQWVLLVNHAENLLSLKTFVPTSAGEVEVKYLSSRDAKHEDPYGGKKRHKRFVFDSHGYRTTPYWFSIII